MTSLNVSLPESMRSFVEEQVARCGFSTTSEYIRHLLRQEQSRMSRQRLESLLLEGLDSGPPQEMTEEWWRRKRAELLAQLRSDSP